MGLVDRYTLLKWKEAFVNLKETFSDASPKTRLLVAGSVLGLLLMGITVSALFSDKQTTPTTPQRTRTLTDTQGDRWTLKYLPGQNSNVLTDDPKKTEPALKLTLKFQHRPPNLLILPELTGAAGEKYYPAAVKNGKWQPPPKLTITDSGGRVLHRGQFEFG